MRLTRSGLHKPRHPEVLREAGEWIETRVADTGTGIAREDLATIFEPFGGSGGARPGEPEGARLGLAVTRKLVELHGGVLRLDSPGLGRGATVTVTLPLPPGRGSAA